MALVYCAPEEARAHILRPARRQFRKGASSNPWHPPSGVGVRTRTTDDSRIFLPHVRPALCPSRRATSGLLEEKVPVHPFARTGDDQEQDFNKPEISEETATVYGTLHTRAGAWFASGPPWLAAHGNRRLERGMNKVGAEGRGESVWNGWFFLTVLRSSAAILHLAW